jgi:restriction system protein
MHKAIGKSGDDGVDSVIDQDSLGVDQIYVEAKKNAEGNNIGAGVIRDFFGALNLKKGQKRNFLHHRIIYIIRHSSSGGLRYTHSAY